MMKSLKRFTGYISVLLLFVAGACSDTSSSESDILGDWVRKSDFEGVARSGAVTFTVGDRVFVGLGFDGTNRLKDFWEYDAARNTWFRRKDFPGAGRNSAVAFSAGGKGYVGTGYDGVNRLKDFYEYDPAGDTWTQIADFGGSGRYNAISLSLLNKGYVGTGYDGNDLKDWWEYDPATAKWTQKVSVGGSKRSNAFSFAINDKGYVGGGINNGIYVTDFWLYDPVNDVWTEKNPLDDTDDSDYTYALQRTYASTFVINGKGYISTGTYSSALTTTWEYDTTTDLWTQKTSFEGTSREAAVGFSIGTKGYITTGRNSSLRFDDIWQFDPTLEYEE